MITTATAPKLSLRSASRFPIYRDDELAALPRQQWTVADVIPRNGFGALIGQPGSLKTFTALDMCAHIELGLPYHGRATAPGRTLYLQAEGIAGMYQRITAWKRYHDVDTLGMLVLPQRVTLNNAADVEEMLTAVDEKQLSRTLDLVVVDTLARHSSMNENSSEDMGAFIRGCDRIREVTGATVLVIHHTGRGADDRGRGSSVLDAAADVVMLATRDEERLTLSCLKQKEAECFAPLTFQAIPAAGSLVLKPIGPTDGELKGKRRACLVALQEESNDNGLSHRAWLDSSGVSKSTFNDAVKWLKANKFVAQSGGKYQLTDAARLALETRAVRSVQPQSGRSARTTPNPLVQSEGVYIHPSLDRTDNYDADERAGMAGE